VDSSTDSRLSLFQIAGLHGRYDVTLSFAEAATIFIADNGAGKTTSLYFLQAILSGQFSKLTRFKYRLIRIKFSDGASFEITPEDLNLSRGVFSLKQLSTRTELDPRQIFELANQARHLSFSDMRDRTLLTAAARQARMPVRMLYDRLVRIDNARAISDEWEAQSDDTSLFKLKTYLSDKFDYSILYLPTYRRVEQGIEHLINAEESRAELSRSDIHFGMKDVQLKINAATSQIRDHFAASYGQISGQMLGQLSEGKAITAEMGERLRDRASAELVLSRIAANVTESQRTNILAQLERGTLLNNRPLAFFLHRLIEAYDQVRGLDDALSSYARICNSYLTNKKMNYDSLSGSLKLTEAITERPIDLDHMSSGEKQILGVMADLYLSNKKRMIVIFDEPELSLSVEWQKKILMDVVAAQNCAFLVAATHSPFVFENELDIFARPLRVKFNPSSDEN
jgi:predicted ATPase